jgi:nitroreductase
MTGPAPTDVFTVIGTQRACREFAAAPVTDDDIARVLDAAVHAPSAENKQPWEFVVVRDPARRAEIGALMARAWEAAGRDFSRGRLTPAMLAEVDRGATGGIAAAPVHVVVGADTRRGLAATAAESIYPAVQNLLLAATALGLGSALTTIALGYDAELRSLVSFPDHVRPMAVVPLGHAARRLGPGRREPFTTRTHRERYGTPWDQGEVGSA